MIENRTELDRTLVVDDELADVERLLELADYRGGRSTADPNQVEAL